MIRSCHGPHLPSRFPWADGPGKGLKSSTVCRAGIPTTRLGHTPNIGFLKRRLACGFKAVIANVLAAPDYRSHQSNTLALEKPRRQSRGLRETPRLAVAVKGPRTETVRDSYRFKDVAGSSWNPMLRSAVCQQIWRPTGKIGPHRNPKRVLLSAPGDIEWSQSKGVEP